MGLDDSCWVESMYWKKTMVDVLDHCLKAMYESHSASLEIYKKTHFLILESRKKVKNRLRIELES